MSDRDTDFMFGKKEYLAYKMNDGTITLVPSNGQDIESVHRVIIDTDTDKLSSIPVTLQ